MRHAVAEATERTLETELEDVVTDRNVRHLEQVVVVAHPRVDGSVPIDRVELVGDRSLARERVDDEVGKARHDRRNAAGVHSGNALRAELDVEMKVRDRLAEPRDDASLSTVVDAHLGGRPFEDDAVLARVGGGKLEDVEQLIQVASPEFKVEIAARSRERQHVVIEQGYRSTLEGAASFVDPEDRGDELFASDEAQKLLDVSPLLAGDPVGTVGDALSGGLYGVECHVTRPHHIRTPKITA